MDTTIPTWGYKPDGSAEIFDLARGEGLPEGWHASPDCIADPVFASAEALTARAEGRFYVPPVADETAADAVAESLNPELLAEVERLKAIIATGSAENEKLAADVETVMTENEALELRASTAASNLDRVVAEMAELKAVLVKAQEDGGFAVSERDEALAQIAALQAELGQARTDLDAATAPAAPAAVKKAAR